MQAGGAITLRQTAVRLVPGRGGTLAPLFHELLDGRAEDDPFLARHRAEAADRALLARLSRALGTGGPLDAAGPVRLHVNLGLATLGGEPFAAFAAACRRLGAAPGVEVPLLECCAAPESFQAARIGLGEWGLPVSVDAIGAPALALLEADVLVPCLDAALFKLSWSPALEALPLPDPARLVLCGADSEAALRWGLARGISRFQGRHADSILAAARMLSCPHAGGCALAQCRERASALAAGGRAACLDPARLDA